MDLHGSTALITGGAHRLGRAIALSLADAGTHIAFTYFSSGRAAAATRRAIEARGVRALAVQADAADDTQMARALEQVGAVFPRLDLWVANAGAFRRTPLTTVCERDWDDMLRLNFATFLVPAQRIGPLMQRQGAGCIVALADVAAIRPWVDYIPYCVAKRAVVALTEELARRLAPQVRVNAIAPGPVLFPGAFPAAARAREVARTRLRRSGAPRHISAAVHYLATNDYVTGTLLPVDGGRLLG
jgi:NAD(P)-dependent dehydrogenase (short-subunit alcohol dehydrogenase family)